MVAAITIATRPAAVQAQLGESDIACENELVQSSAAFNSACCPTASACTDGHPNSCSADCAQAFMPFYSRCQAFVATNLPDLVSFGDSCSNSGVDVAPTPPPASIGGAQYVSVTATITAGAGGHSSKKQKRFESEFRQDVAEALSTQQDNVIVTALSDSSITFGVFVTSSAEANAMEVPISQSILEHLRASQSISEHLRTSQNISEHLRTSQNISEHLRASQNTSEHLRTSQNISEHLRASQNISEHLRISQSISEHLRTPQSISEHLRTSQNISKH
eukprot:SAG31_NODE_5527_length_2477_cov_1.710681_1_plen_276_part_10